MLAQKNNRKIFFLLMVVILIIATGCRAMNHVNSKKNDVAQTHQLAKTNNKMPTDSSKEKEEVQEAVAIQEETSAAAPVEEVPIEEPVVEQVQAQEVAPEETVVEEPVNDTAAVQELPETQQAPATPQEPQTTPQTLYIAGAAISFQEGGQGGGQAIIDGNLNLASTYGGAAHYSAADNQNTHFIAHNPGVFSCLLSLAVGNVITITDSNNIPANYIVREIHVSNVEGYDTQTGEDLWYRILDSGNTERVTLQTCLGENRLIITADLM